MNKLYLVLIVFLIISCKTQQPQEQDKLAVPQFIRDTSIVKEIDAVENSKNINILKNISTDTIDYYKNDFLRYNNYIYKPNVKTVLLHKSGWELSNPIIELNSGEKLLLSFDDLDADRKRYQYTLIHCNSDWTPSDLNTGEYLSGFYADYITESQPSVNTLQPYTHYELEFPHENVNPLISGNYILKVFLDEPDSIVLTHRLMILENKISIKAQVRQATVIEDKNYKQEIIFSIEHSAYNIINPYANLKVILMQNQRWDNVISDLKPSLARNNELIYEYEYGNVFQGDNEYRAFDTKSLKYYSEAIQNIQKRNNCYHVFLNQDERRSFKRYLFQNDINGKFAVKNEDASNSKTEAEYCLVYFSLPYSVPLIHGQIYIFGALSGWSFNDDCIMVYNYTTKTYEKALYLKQGYYNYQYAFLENGTTTADISFIEGTHSQTENDYTILVYYKEPTAHYEKLIGLKFFNTLKK